VGNGILEPLKGVPRTFGLIRVYKTGVVATAAALDLPGAETSLLCQTLLEERTSLMGQKRVLRAISLSGSFVLYRTQAGRGREFGGGQRRQIKEMLQRVTEKT